MGTGYKTAPLPGPTIQETPRHNVLPVRIAFAIVGWFLFFYWWRQVLAATDKWAWILTLATLQIVTAMVGIIVGTIAWIMHNLKIARRNRRGSTSWYVPAKFDKDRLDRELVLPPQLREAPLMTIDVKGEKKVYLVPPQEKAGD